MSEINYTVIIPHKNTPSLLQKCLDSIPEKETVQVIVVDDNSDPKVVDFDNFPGHDRKNVETYFLKENEAKGAGKARNIGLEHAKGKWLIFSDSDDYFTEDFTLYLDKYLDSDYDVVMFDIESRDIETLELTKEGEEASARLHQVDFSDKKKAEWYCFNHEVPWGMMVNKKLVDKHNIRFDEVLASNDTMFVLQSFYYAERMTFLDHVLYCWIIRSNSLVHAKPKLPVVMARYEVDLRRNRFCIDHGYRKYTRSIANWLLMISKFGIRPLFKAICLCFHYRINPFTKCGNWFKSLTRKFKHES